MQNKAPQVALAPRMLHIPPFHFPFFPHLHMVWRTHEVHTNMQNKVNIIVTRE